MNPGARDRNWASDRRSAMNSSSWAALESEIRSSRSLVEAASDWPEKWSVSARSVTHGIRAISRNQTVSRVAMLDRRLRIEESFMRGRSREAGVGPISIRHQRRAAAGASSDAPADHRPRHRAFRSPRNARHCSSERVPT